MTRPAQRATLHPDFATWEERIRAFVCLADDSDERTAGPLAGCTVAVKDVIDVAGLPTRNGSAACADTGPAPADALVVARLRRAGARIVGKTVTTEFAFTDPTSCRNPYDPDRSPGGSSSGSGAAVGAGLVDIALGTQTAGSLCRPAAYCGAVGFKPSLGMLPMDGVTPLSRSHDMVGIIARDVGLAETAFSVMRGASAAVPDGMRQIGRMILDTETRVDPTRLEALDDAIGLAITMVGRATALAPPDEVARIVADHRMVMTAEAAACHGGLFTEAARLQPNFRAALRDGREADPAAVRDAAQRLVEARTAFWARHAAIDVILTLPVPDAPPLMGPSTGFQHWLTVWTVLGGPLLCLPWGLDPQGLPRSVMLAGRPGEDARLLRFGRDLEAAAPPTPPPALPPG